MIVVDRLEGDFAVLEVHGALVNFPRKALPEGTKEGDVLSIVRTEGSTEEDEARLSRLKKKTKQGPGDFEL